MAGIPEQSDPRAMAAMFSAIAPRYDFITRAFSFGMDGGWKRLGVAAAGLGERPRVLDLACGTGDFSRLVDGRYAGAVPIGADLTWAMLRRARAGGLRRVVVADAQRLPFAGESFDAVFAGYALRNFPDLEAAAGEIRRVLRPGGQLVALDFFLPESPVWRKLFLGYLWAQGAFWGGLLHGRPRTYTYIPDSLRRFHTLAGIQALLAGHALEVVRTRSFLGGGIGLVWARRLTTAASAVR